MPLINYLKIIKGPSRDIVIKLFHHVPRTISNTNQYDWKRKFTVKKHINQKRYLNRQNIVNQQDNHLASTMASTVFCSCGLSLPRSVSILLVTCGKYQCRWAYTKQSTIIAIESLTNYFKLHCSNHDFKYKKLQEEWNFMYDKYIFPVHLKSNVLKAN